MKDVMRCFKSKGTLALCWAFSAMLSQATALSEPAWSFSLEVAEAPSTALSLTSKAIQGARHSILLNIYEMTSPEITDALVEKIHAGVKVVILEEGQPVRGMSVAGRRVQQRLINAMRSSNPQSRLFEMTSKVGPKRRFRFNHGKYAIIDGNQLLLGSENYSPTGQAKPGARGNRGWQVLVHEKAIANEYESVFAQDSNLAAGDMFDLTELGVACRPGIPGCYDSFQNLLTTWLQVGQRSDAQSPNEEQRQHIPYNEDARTVVKPYAPWDVPQTLEATHATRITSPDSSLSGLLHLLGSATHSIDLEQMTFAPGWDKVQLVSPLLEAVVLAARRGVKVRVLLNDERVFDEPGQEPGKHKNDLTVAQLNAIAAEENLPLIARIADLKKMGVTYIHNKGALVDGNKTLISSINWNMNSVTKNREGAVVITSPEVYNHYRRLFDNDWSRSETQRHTRAAFPLELGVD